MINVYILLDDAEGQSKIIGVYKTRKEALKDAQRLELKSWYVTERALKLV